MTKIKAQENWHIYPCHGNRNKIPDFCTNSSFIKGTENII